ncbi:MAG: phosphoserine phosphatase SerB [Pseudomonadota bacterium]|nr:phosphoserine phosphatase SerB [Pseudomonadota bacterium]
MEKLISCIITNSTKVTGEQIQYVLAEFEKLNITVQRVQRLGIDGVRLNLWARKKMIFPQIEESIKADINLLTNDPKPRKLLFSDMDSTIITVECIDEIADFLGLRHQVQELTAKSMRGEIDFSESLKERVKLLKGLTITDLDECFKSRIEISKGAKTLVSTMRKFGAKSVLISGGFSFFSDKVSSLVGFDRSFANELIVEDNLITGYLKEPLLDRKLKRSILLAVCREMDIDARDVIAVGDGANDVDMILEAGLGVSYYGQPVLKAASDIRISYSNFRALLYCQGIGENEFVLE